jgi:hypothetical protein
MQSTRFTAFSATQQVMFIAIKVCDDILILDALQVERRTTWE